MNWIIGSCYYTVVIHCSFAPKYKLPSQGSSLNFFRTGNASKFSHSCLRLRNASISGFGILLNRPSCISVISGERGVNFWTGLSFHQPHKSFAPPLSLPYAYHPHSAQNCRSIVFPLTVFLFLYDLSFSDPVMTTAVLAILRMLAEARQVLGQPS
jgi:hypothetical protein